MTPISVWHSVRRRWGVGAGSGGLKTRNTRWILMYWLDDPERSRHRWILRGQWDLLTGMLIYWACLSWFWLSVCVDTTGGKNRNIVGGCPVVLFGQWRQRWGIQQVHAVTRMLWLYLLVGSAMQVNTTLFSALKKNGGLATHKEINQCCKKLQQHHVSVA